MEKAKNILTLTTFVFFFLYFFINVATVSESARYVPEDDITVNCGSPDNQPAWDHRIWTGDNDKDSRFKLVEDKPNREKSNCSTATSRSDVDPVPYLTARISRSNFTYTFRFSVPGPKFIRLHFFPAKYSDQSIDVTDSFFDVRAGPFTLLQNFSASMFAAYTNQSAFAKEFVLIVEESNGLISIDVDFIPTSSSSHAFVNAIEAVSMPGELYYAPKGDQAKSPKFVGSSGNQFGSYSDRALETLYRLNIGGKAIPPDEDTGMYREWSQERNYFTSLGYLPSNASFELKYSVIPNYTAPDEVYRTAISMGPDAEKNSRSNLSWSFPVDRGFYYLVRLHFCELVEKYTAYIAKRFYVYIEDQTAEMWGNIAQWTGERGVGVPVYRDYVVNIRDEDFLFVDITTRAEESTYDDASLNGIEVFKMSSAGKKSLAGPNPNVNVTREQDEPEIPEKKSDSKRRALLIAALSSAGFVLMLCVVFCAVVLRRKDHYRKRRRSKPESKLPEERCRHFQFWEIEEATEGFAEERVVGRGGFGKVYKGYIDGDKSKAVAVKRLNQGSTQGEDEFVMEIKLLSRLRHVNLVSLLGYCDDGGEMILVYEYIANGTLRDHLFGSPNYEPLPWRARLEACIGAARGLHYLHAGAGESSVIHRDVKTANILLDEKWSAKVADFGLSRLGRAGGGAVTTFVKGTPGYLDPEYYQREKLADKSDVYSFGVVLFEVLCARKPVDFKLPGDQRNLAPWARKCARDGTIHAIVDPFLMGKISPDCLRKFVEVADSCLRDTWDRRPTMGEVVELLEFALKLQLEADTAAEKLAGDGDGDGDGRNKLHYYPDVEFRVVDDVEYDVLGLRSGAGFGGEVGGSGVVGGSFVTLETESYNETNMFSETTADSESRV